MDWRNRNRDDALRIASADVMSRPAVHIMLDALQRLGHPMDGYIRTPHTEEAETLRYDGTHGGKYTGYTEECTWKRGDRFGKGNMEYDNGHAYDGEWDRDCMNGQGTFSKKNEGRDGWLWVFEGIFEDNCPLSGTLREWSRRGIENEIQSDVWVKARVYDQKPAQPNKGGIRPLPGTTYYPDGRP